mmetsp:Transcript_14030/g.30370  ORF Transcript_14030/g.30370 Transcript_14030/m.30370 type:complete len:421 (+) Transcript_14030:579-1841(+)
MNGHEWAHARCLCPCNVERLHVCGIQEGVDLEQLPVHAGGHAIPVPEAKLPPVVGRPARCRNGERALVNLPPQGHSRHLHAVLVSDALDEVQQSLQLGPTAVVVGHVQCVRHVIEIWICLGGLGGGHAQVLLVDEAAHQAVPRQHLDVVLPAHLQCLGMRAVSYTEGDGHRRDWHSGLDGGHDGTGREVHQPEAAHLLGLRNRGVPTLLVNLQLVFTQLLKGLEGGQQHLVLLGVPPVELQEVQRLHTLLPVQRGAHLVHQGLKQGGAVAVLEDVRQQLGEYLDPAGAALLLVPLLEDAQDGLCPLKVAEGVVAPKQVAQHGVREERPAHVKGGEPCVRQLKQGGHPGHQGKGVLLERGLELCQLSLGLGQGGSGSFQLSRLGLLLLKVPRPLHCNLQGPDCDCQFIPFSQRCALGQTLL